MTRSDIATRADPATVLTDITERVRPLLPEEQGRSLDETLSRVRSGRVRVLVLGEAKRGKSTLANRIFTADLLPTGALPLTSVATIVTVGPDPRAQVRYLDGRVSALGLDEVAGLVSQRENPGNRKGVDRVRVTAPCRYLPAGTEVVDTPGTGSVHLANTEESARARACVDIAVLVVAADPPISAAELSLFSDVLATAAAAVVVVNKTDLVAPEDVREIVEFTRQAIHRTVHQDVPVLPVCLRTGIGFGELIAWLHQRLDTSGERDVATATARALRRDVTAVLDGLRVEHELLRQTRQDSTQTVVALRDILDHAHASSAAAIDHI